MLRHHWTVATVHKAGRRTSLVRLDEWYGGQILASVPTRALRAALGQERRDLPGTAFWVMAQLGATTADELDLREWVPCRRVPPAGGGRAA
ncbi:hypothetical protein [Streptomyces sp. NPDC096153]|uniref:hypothetical protein n=1 Tax=Streptomyces sp. NPDC096153 TaxID=3155548 RepID=UPI00332BC969